MNQPRKLVTNIGGKEVALRIRGEYHFVISLVDNTPFILDKKHRVLYLYVADHKHQPITIWDSYNPAFPKDEYHIITITTSEDKVKLTKHIRGVLYYLIANEYGNGYFMSEHKYKDNQHKVSKVFQWQDI